MMKNMYKLSVIILFAGLIMTSCGTKSSNKEPIVLPNISDKGVEPFLLGTNMRTIPQKGNYYDTILYTFKYHVKGSLDTEHFEWDEHQMEEYRASIKSGETFYNDISIDEYSIESAQSLGYVMLGSDTLMVVTCNSDWNIECIKIVSDKFCFENGVHVGLSSEEMNKKYNAEYICEGYSILCRDTTTVDMGYYISTMSSNINLFAAGNNRVRFEEDESGYNMIPVHGKDLKGNLDLFLIPLDDVRNDFLKYIVIHGQCNHHEYDIVKNDFFKL